MNKIVSAARERIEKLKKEKNQFAIQADIAYAKKEFVLERELQKEIDSRNTEIEQLESRLLDIESPHLDIDDLIEKKRKEHDWTHNERCRKCGMKKSTTFEWKVHGVRDNFKDGFKSQAMTIIDSMTCKRS